MDSSHICPTKTGFHYRFHTTALWARKPLHCGGGHFRDQSGSGGVSVFQGKTQDVSSRFLFKETYAHRKKWQHWKSWVSGCQVSLGIVETLIFADHKNLKYLHTAKRLNPWQACWALFFTRFNFTISYHPVSKNTKADALSRLYTESLAQSEPETILPTLCFVNAISWEFDRDLTNSMPYHTVHLWNVLQNIIILLNYHI